MDPASGRTVAGCRGTGLISAPAINGQKNEIDGHKDIADDGTSPCKTVAPSLCSRILKCLYAVRLEIFVLLYLHGRAMVATAIQDFLLQKACLNNLEYSWSVCDHVDNFPNIKNEAEKIASNYNMYRIIVYLGPSSAISIFVGPWCDKYGYKTPLLVANLGYIVSTVITLFTVYYMHLPLYFNVLAMISDGLCGGFVVVFMAVYSEATLETQNKQRRAKFSRLNLAVYVAFPMGVYTGGQIYGSFGINAVLVASVCTLVVAELWALFTFSVPDEVSRLDDSLWMKVKCLFQLRNFLDGFRACTRSRPAKGRAQLWCLLIALSFRIMDATRMGVSYYYARRIYSWSVAYYSTVTAVTSVVTVLLNIPIIWLFTSVLKMSDLWMSIVGVCFSAAQLLLCGLAYNEWLYYLQCAAGVPSIVAYVGIRTHLSNLLEHHEVGKVFSFVSSCESLLPVVGEVIFTEIFNWSLDFMPGLVYLMAAAASALPLALLGYCARVSAQSYMPVEDHPETDRGREDDARGDSSSHP